jgi:hypothetical protein
MVDSTIHYRLGSKEAAVHKQITKEQACHTYELIGTDLIEFLHLSAALAFDVFTDFFRGFVLETDILLLCLLECANNLVSLFEEIPICLEVILGVLDLYCTLALGQGKQKDLCIGIHKGCQR